MNKKKICHNCKHRGDYFKIPPLKPRTYHHCNHPDWAAKFKAGDNVSAWDTLNEFWDTCNKFESNETPELLVNS